MSLQVPREGLTQKLQKLSQTQQSIESVSSFCIFYHKDAKGVVQIWEQEFYKANNERKLALMYLANHILQEGRKKSLGFQEEYFRVLPKALAHMVKHGDEKHRKALTKCVTVWEERKVFGTRHMKSFKEVLGLPSEPKPAAAATASQSAGSAAAAGAVVAKLGPVGDALLLAQKLAAETTSKNQEFTSSWSQSLLATSGLPEVTACQSTLVSYTAALQAELEARQAALNALTAELARQTTEVNRVESQLQAVGAQKQQLDGRLHALTQAAMVSLGQMFQQNGAAVLGAGTPTAAAGAAAATDAVAADAVGSPQAPELELEEDDDVYHATAPSFQAGAAAAAAGGAMGLQPNTVQQPVQLVPPDLQALLANPHMLSAAIQSTQVLQPPPLAAAAAAPSIGFGASQGMGLQMGAAADGGVQLQLPSGPIGAVPPGAEGSFSFAAPPVPPVPPAVPAPYAGDAAAGLAMQGGFMLGQQAGGYGGLTQLEQQQSGFADEADDPYDPEHEEY